jgi:hypothetical protein
MRSSSACGPLRRIARRRWAYDFADIRELVFSGDKRKLMDMRRSGVVGPSPGGIDAVGLAAKLARSAAQTSSIGLCVC